MKRNQKRSISTRKMVIMAALIAIQIILSRYLSIQASETLRISFETIPLALAGMWLGPVSGAFVALVSDVLGTIIHGYGIWFPPIALGPMLFAAMCGWGVKYVFRSSISETKDAWKVITLTVVAGLVNAFVVGIVTTTLYQMIIVGKEGTFGVLLGANFLSRLPTKPITVAASAILVALIHRTAYRPVISRIVNRNKK